MSNIPDLWGALSVEEDAQKRSNNPSVLLKEQATLLGQKTKGLILGEVISIDPIFLDEVDKTRKDLESNVLKFLLELQESEQKPFCQIFRLKTPSLNNYTYSLLQVIYPVALYPCVVSNLVLPSKNDHKLCETKDELLKAIEDILSSSVVHEVIQVLLSQID